MTSDRWEQINRICEAAVEIEEKKRGSFLDEACREDWELRREVESLLAMQAQADGFLEKPAVEEVVKAIKEEPPSLLGRKLGPYQILAALGAGGMGEVYKARDMRLDRTVAIKVLPRYLSQRADLRQRFEREARALASLSHPHVCPIHDIGREDGIDFLVMEYLEGETLARRLSKGALPLEQALQYGVEIAQALDEAHRHGVIHRDLKPGNIMLTKTGAKLLDFGLAKQGGTRTPARTDERARGTSVPGKRFTESLTEEGMILGTLEYMAPEQVEGKQADARTDIFALGVVLYEMVTGKKAFEGESKASLIAAILTSQPAPVTTIQPLTPPLERLVVRCLAKHPDDRIQTAHDAELLLRWIAEEHRSPAVTGARQAPAGVKRPRFIMAAAIVALALALAYLYHVWPQRLQAKAFVLPPENAAFNLLGDNAAPPVLSPDGSAVVFGAGDQLWLRPLGELSPRPLSDTQGARFPFWSPDSKSLGFFAEGKLKVMEIATGAPIAIADVSEARGGSWSRDGTIIFEPHWQGPLYRVPATGGASVAITKIDQTRHTTHRWPHFLADGKHFLYLALNHNRPRDPQNTVFIASVDGKVNRPLLPLSSNAQFAAGYVFYIRDNTLLAQRLNQRTLQLEGNPVRIASGVVDDSTWRGGFTVSSAGTLAYVPSGRPVAQMTWMDRSGKELGVVGEPADIQGLRLSPDSQRVAFNIDQDIYVMDIARGIPTKLTFNHGVNWSPTWSPDGRWIAYAISWPDSSETRIVRKPSNGTGPEEILYSSKDDLVFPTAWSPDSRFLLLTHYLPAGIEVLPLEGERKPYKAVPHLVEELGGTLSPDGRWLAYASRESGRSEIYVVPFPGPGGKRQVSANGASTAALWSHDGKELYYADSSMDGHAIAIRPSGNELTILDTRPILPGLKDLVGIDVARDGRFLVARGSRTRPPSAIVLVTNWRAQVEE